MPFPFSFWATVSAGGTPTLASATVDVTGAILTLNFSSAVQNGSGGSGGVTISASGGACTATYSSGSGSSSLVYGLSRTINAGETVTVSYTQPGNGIEATGGTDVATFSGSSVTNNSTAGGSGITLDNVTGDTLTGGSSKTIPFVVGSGSNRALFVSAAVLGDAPTVTGVTYNGVAMTQLWQLDASTSGVLAKNSGWILVAPASGNHNVVVTYSAANGGYAAFGVASFAGVNQTTPNRTVYTGGPGATDPTLTVANAVNGDTVIAAVSTYNSGLTLACGKTQQVIIDPVNGSSYGFAMETAGATGSTIMDFTGGNNFWTEGAVALVPV